MLLDLANRLKSVATVLFKGVEPDFSKVRRDIEAAIRYFTPDLPIHEMAIAIPPGAYIAERGQLDANSLIRGLTDSEVVQERKLTLAFTEKDMFYEKMNFVFGLAHAGLAKAVISTFRLSRDPMLSPVSEGAFRERVFKECMHEIGHVWALGHCHDKKCVMSFSSTIIEVDRKLPKFCGNCELKLAAGLGR